jgi:hypothetical protein
MKAHLRRAGVLACALLGACGGSSPSVGAAPQAPALTIDVGLATLTDLESKGRRIIEQNRYEVIRTTPAPDVSYETAWLTRVPLDDERAAGVVAAQSRLFIRARQRNYTGGGGDTWQVTVTMENAVKTSESADFVAVRPSGEFERFARRMAGELKTLFETGIRRP